MSNSIGDLKNSGLQGNNFPWQYKVLKGLQSIIDGQCDCSLLGLLVPIEKNTNLTQQNTKARSVRGFIDRYPFGSTGSIGTDVYSISIANTGTADATVNGAAIRPGEVLNFDAGALNNFFQPNFWNFDCTANPGAELLVTYIRT